VNPVFDPQPVLLTGRHVRLEPLALGHAEALFAASRDPGIWTYLLVPQFASVSEVKKWIDESLAAQVAGQEVAFATVRSSDGVPVGSTRFLDIRRPHRTLEIGWTWLAPEAQRTAVNTEAKYLMLRHAFEMLGAVRVQLKTDERNARSRAAISRLGAAFEGILRNLQTYSHGYVRNTAMFSITAAEWPVVKARLEEKLAR
jgi:RimJ/RimL family protein N-acetyltransferase